MDINKPEDVEKFLNDNFLHMNLYNTVAGFALFFLDNPNFLPLIIKKMNILAFDEEKENV